MNMVGRSLFHGSNWRPKLFQMTKTSYLSDGVSCDQDFIHCVFGRKISMAYYN